MCTQTQVYTRGRQSYSSWPRTGNNLQICQPGVDNPKVARLTGHGSATRRGELTGQRGGARAYHAEEAGCTRTCFIMLLIKGPDYLWRHISRPGTPYGSTREWESIGNGHKETVGETETS